jgi:ElaB/YqjD/DUF883 family membrane-anchored ribosome-binding protein
MNNDTKETSANLYSAREKKDDFFKTDDKSNNARLHSMIDSTSETLGNAGDKISKGYESTKHALKKAGSQFEHSIRENPLVAVSAAVAIGWMVGRFFTSRSLSARTH